MSSQKIQDKVVATRFFRKAHKWMGIPLILFFFLTGVTAILLAWKKKVELLPPTQQSQQTGGDWIVPSEMIRIGEEEMKRLGMDPEIDRIDIRPDKGIAKLRFKSHFTEVQLDGYSGAVVSIETRHADWIEKVHDGSIVDFYFTEGEGAKLTYSTLISLGLIGMGISGFYLWYYPKVIRGIKKEKTTVL